MMTLANYGIGSSKHKDPNSAKVLSKSLQVRTRAERLLCTTLKSFYRITDDKRNDIINLITDYYSRIPFNVVIWNKYQTKQCIVDSILLLDSKFNPYKAKKAFEIVERMLINLVYLPWHKEFRSIHTYSGKFKSSISEPLIGIEEVFKAAGFEYAKNNLLHLILPEDKMPQVDDSESVTSVIFDCLIAQVILNDIIEVYEKCNKTKRSDTKDVNYYSWIQAYFRERSNQTTEKACTNIAELLNNITNYIIKLEKSQQSSNIERNNSIGSNSGVSVVRSVTTNSIRNNNSPKSLSTSNQEWTRDFLAHQAKEEDTLLTLPNDLLRLPVSETTSNINKKQVNHADSALQTQEQDYLQEFTRSFNMKEFRQQLEKEYPNQNTDTLIDKLPTINQSRKSGFNNLRSISSSSNDTRDFVDHHSYHHNRNNNNNNHNQIILDTPHNDCEPLIPNRYDRRVITHQIPGANNSSSSKRYSLYDNTNDHHQSTSMNDLGGHSDRVSVTAGGFRGNRYQFDDDHCELSSHSQSSSSYQRGLNNLNEYNAPSYRK